MQEVNANGQGTNNFESGDGPRNNRQSNTSYKVVGSMPSNIELLNGRENYSTWSFAVRMMLIVEDLWEVVQPPVVNGVTEPVDMKKDQLAMAKLALLVHKTLFVHINDSTSAKSMWEKLKSTFEDNGLLRRVGLLRSLINTKLSSSGSVEQFVNEIMSNAHKLNSIGFKIDDEWLGTFLLAGLPERYEPMIMAWESSGQKISADAVKTKLLQEVNFREDCDSGTSVALAASRDKDDTKICFECNEAGHFKRNCPMLKKKNKKEFKKAWAALMSYNLSSSESIEHNGSWYIDSGATSHMTHSRELLDDIRENSGIITLANNEAIKVTGCGDMVVKVKDCNYESISVKEVKLVPDLSVNLLSVHEMVEKDLTVVFEKSGCKVINQSGAVLARGVHENKMFRLMLEGTPIGRKKPKYIRRARTKGLAQEKEMISVGNDPVVHHNFMSRSLRSDGTKQT